MSLLAGRLFSFVFDPIGLTHFGKFLLASQLFLRSLLLSLLFFLGKSESGGFKFAHSRQLFLLLLDAGIFFFKVGLSAGFLLSSFSLETETLCLSELGTAGGLGSLLLLAFLFDLLAELFLLFLLLLDDGEVRLLFFVFILNHARLLTICLFIIFSIDRGVVLILPTTTFALRLAIFELVVFIDCAREEVTLLAVQLAHKVLLALVTLDSHFVDGVFNLDLGVDIVFEATNHIVLRELVVAIILVTLAWREGPCDAHARVVLLVPTRAKFDHRLAATIAKHVQQVIELIV